MRQVAFVGFLEFEWNLDPYTRLRTLFLVVDTRFVLYLSKSVPVLILKYEYWRAKMKVGFQRFIRF